MTNSPQLPPNIPTRLRRDVRRRGLWLLLGVVLAVAAALGLTALVGLGLDRWLLLPAFVRAQAGWLLAPPLVVGGAALGLWFVRNHLTARDLRRLDNADDDLRAAMNLVERAERGESGLDAALVAQSVERAAQFAAQPLPPLPEHRRRVQFAAVACAAVVVGLLGVRMLAGDLHTGLSRYFEPAADFGSIGPRKFHLQAEVWQNPGTPLPGAAVDATPRKLADVYFLRARREKNAWKPNFDDIPLTLADRLAGPNPRAVHNRTVEALEGDRLRFKFQALDADGRADLDDLELIRLEGPRALRLRYLKVDEVGTLALDRVREDFDFQLRAQGQFSPVYQVRGVRRTTPTQIYLFERQPAQYGKASREIVVRDRRTKVEQNRLTGLPGARLAIEFVTPYGADLDPHASYAALGDGRRLKLRYATSRNAARRAAGEKLWTFDFTLDEKLKAQPRLYLHLATKEARFRGAPITNLYDEPFAIQWLDDLPPTVEFTQLPEARHFAVDDVFAFRYHYADDYGVAEVGLEIQKDPNTTQVEYVPLPLREADEPGGLRREDELLYALDLQPLYHQFANFAIVVKDVQGQVAKTGMITVTTSQNETETLLPRLTGGWGFAWGHAPDRANLRAGDLETSPAAKQAPTYRAALNSLRHLLDGRLPSGAERDGQKPLPGKTLGPWVKQLQFDAKPYLVNENQPFAYHHRDYPNYFQRQASAYLTALPLLGGEPLDEVRRRVEALGESPDVFAAPEYEELKKQRPWLDEQAAQADLIAQAHAEIALRAALLRAADACETIRPRLAEVEALVAQLRKEAGPAPPAAAAGDAWRSYPQWVQTQHPDFNLRERARQAALLIRGLDRRMANLNAVLNSILSEHRDGLDPRLLAVTAMVAQFGPSVHDVDRRELAAKAELLSAFIREGMLAGESDVYRRIADEFPACRDKAEQAREQLPIAAQLPERWQEFAAAAQRLADADLARRMGEPRFAATLTLRAAENRRARLRGELEELGQVLNGLLHSPEYADLTELPALRERLQDLAAAMNQVQSVQAEWPAVQDRAADFATVQQAADRLAACVTATLQLRAALGTLAGFAPVFTADAFPASRARDAVEEARAALAEIAEEAPVVQGHTARLDAALRRTKQALTTIMASSRAEAAPPRRTPTAPPAKLTAATTRLREELSCAQRIARLNEDLQRFRDQPERQAAAIDAATRYFVNVPLDAGKDASANPVEEYLNARLAAALYVCSPEYMTPFAETYARDGNGRKAWLKAYFDGRELPLAVAEKIDKTDYKTPELPPEAAPLAEPYLRAFREEKLPEFLRTERERRLAEAAALAQRLGDASRRYEALIRVRDLATLLDELQDDVRLLRYPADDLRVRNLWSEAVEQATGLDYDLLAGRFPQISAEVKKRMQAEMPVFRRRTYAEVVAQPETAAKLAAYQQHLRAWETELLPVVKTAEEALRGDMAALERDLALVVMSSLQTQYWFEQQLQLELLQKQILLGDLTGKTRITQRLPMGSTASSVELMRTASVVAYGWRSICNLRSGSLALDPTEERRNALVHDLSLLAALKILPEYYFDNYTGALALRTYVATKACDAAAELMLTQLRTARDVNCAVIRLLTQPRSAGVATRNVPLVDLLGQLAASGIVFQLEETLTTYQELRRTLQTGEPGAVQQATRQVRTLPAALGRFGRRVGRSLADALALGETLLDAEQFAALAPDAQRQLLARHRACLEQAQRTVIQLGVGMEETQRAELAALDEALQFDQEWFTALAERSAAASEAFQPGYREMHEALQSLLLSLQGNMYPDEPTYPARLRYKHAMFHFDAFHFGAEIVATERRWFNRADQGLAAAYDELLSLSSGRQAGAAVDPLRGALAFSRFVDAKFRYLMAFNAPKAEFGKPTPRVLPSDDRMPEHLGRAFGNALTIDLPDQDNRRVREEYFEALQNARTQESSR